MSTPSVESDNRSIAVKNVLEELSRKLNFCFKLKAEQSRALNNFLDGNDVFAVLPTGYGKSLIFQLSVLVAERERKQPAIAIIICPLLRIIEDQMEEAKDLRISSVCLSDAPNTEDIKSGKFQLILGSAKNVLNNCFVDVLKDSSCHLHNCLAALVVDESHVIETWTGER